MLDLAAAPVFTRAAAKAGLSQGFSCFPERGLGRQGLRCVAPRVLEPWLKATGAPLCSVWILPDQGRKPKPPAPPGRPLWAEPPEEPWRIIFRDGSLATGGKGDRYLTSPSSPFSCSNMCLYIFAHPRSEGLPLVSRSPGRSGKARHSRRQGWAVSQPTPTSVPLLSQFLMLEITLSCLSS